MAKRVLAAALFLVGALVLAGCGPHWVIVRQVAPSPFGPGAKVFVDRVSLENLMVGQKTEAEWMSEKKDETRDKWDGDKQAMNEKFIQAFYDSANGVALDTTQQQGDFIVRAHFVHYEPGFYAYVVNNPATIDADFFILDPAGNVLDEIKLKGSANGISAGDRARSCASQVGSAAGKYVRQRFGL
jgi:hypothetical protein